MFSVEDVPWQQTLEHLLDLLVTQLRHVDDVHELLLFFRTLTPPL